MVVCWRLRTRARSSRRVALYTSTGRAIRGDAAGRGLVCATGQQFALPVARHTSMSTHEYGFSPQAGTIGARLQLALVGAQEAGGAWIGEGVVHRGEGHEVHLLAKLVIGSVTSLTRGRLPICAAVVLSFGSMVGGCTRAMRIGASVVCPFRLV